MRHPWLPRFHVDPQKDECFNFVESVWCGRSWPRRAKKKGKWIEQERKNPFSRSNYNWVTCGFGDQNGNVMPSSSADVSVEINVAHSITQGESVSIAICFASVWITATSPGKEYVKNAFNGWLTAVWCTLKAGYILLSLPCRQGKPNLNGRHPLLKQIGSNVSLKFDSAEIGPAPSLPTDSESEGHPAEQPRPCLQSDIRYELGKIK